MVSLNIESTEFFTRPYLIGVRHTFYWCRLGDVSLRCPHLGTTSCLMSINGGSVLRLSRSMILSFLGNGSHLYIQFYHLIDSLSYPCMFLLTDLFYILATGTAILYIGPLRLYLG
ncbi:hypothetical protein EV421DRAFT_110135 [Armillaria borealis]|uniref:Uncharacterized protein n=1 Tax=Armillaria borealis TaxID=47425 RepID=A0AA39JWT3_9AGAR|nr:hypothetical protein EV421DRAFT_110135 [Armillaria borealis]